MDVQQSIFGNKLIEKLRLTSVIKEVASLMLISKLNSIEITQNKERKNYRR